MDKLLLKGKRISKGITQAKAAEAIGMYPTTYSLKESGRRGFTLDEANRVAALLEMSNDEIADIFFDDALPNSNEAYTKS